MDAQITVGLDFGTHQTKICVSENYEDGRDSKYTFFTFRDLNGCAQLTLPSVIQINDDDTLSYGYVDGKRCSYFNKSNMAPEPEPPMKVEPVLPARPQPVPLPPKPKGRDRFVSWKDALAALATNSHKGHMSWKEECKSIEESNAAALAKWEQSCKDILNKAKEENYRKMSIYQQQHSEWMAHNSPKKAVFRYFKQATFAELSWESKPILCDMLTVWYLSFLLFDLEERYGNNFSIQMGVPSGNDRIKQQKYKATKLLLSAYHLVEDIFMNDKDRFLSTPYPELEKLTEFVPCTDEKKFEYGILIFPEAYANMLPLTSKRKIPMGLTLLIDIGGGTTDITYFMMESMTDGVIKPHIYYYDSIYHGLNFVIKQAGQDIERQSLNIASLSRLLNASKGAVDIYCLEVAKRFTILRDKIVKMYKETNRHIAYLQKSLNGRPVIYSGGGSSFKCLDRPIPPYRDVRTIDSQLWNDLNVSNRDIIDDKAMHPILNTALGLSMPAINDDISISSIDTLFTHIHQDDEPSYGYDHTLADVN